MILNCFALSTLTLFSSEIIRYFFSSTTSSLWPERHTSSAWHNCSTWHLSSKQADPALLFRLFKPPADSTSCDTVHPGLLSMFQPHSVTASPVPDVPVLSTLPRRNLPWFHSFLLAIPPHTDNAWIHSYFLSPTTELFLQCAFFSKIQIIRHL